ncbi:MAG: outer membrane lipoprotein-sorting protein [Nitrosospira sp.]|jgi:outer membrane lipoprotein-sorting protein|nr:outer membrane lipoprotein-sorting protein [Nitrosospira sp.]MBN9127004.1 outer membrane lipoprotein-sorting protein [Nitrosospira sp.]OJY13714.1 MAG: outer membrane lipoprotein-sorting protein [Nitrosospira sp. 56-18]
MKITSLKQLVAAICLLSGTVCGAADDTEFAQNILEKADQIRFPRESFQVDVNITTTSPEQSTDLHHYRVLSKGNENSVVMTLEPASERGQILLMKGRDLWIFMPEITQPIRLSMSQRLTGQVANGDLARANFAGDYTATLLRTDVIDGEKYHVLELVGVDKGVTYHKVLYWVQQSNFWPYRAEFYSVSGRLLKTSRYENFRMLLGKQRPTRLVMEDALRKDEKSVLDYSDMKLRDLPDKVFTKDYLKKLE